MSEILVNKLTGTSTAGSIVVTGEGNSTTTNLQQGLAKSWNNINSSFTVQDSFNVASCVDEGGAAPNTYTINMTNAMANTTYMAHGNAETSGQAPRTIGISSPATSSYFVTCCVTNTPSDSTSVVGNTAVLGDLA
jgi:hypothetical protein